VRGEVVAETGCRFIVHGAQCDGPRGLTKGKDALAWFMRGEWGVLWCCVRAKLHCDQRRLCGTRTKPLSRYWRFWLVMRVDLGAVIL
jgi:hypothetical protein